jgi:DNA polymerase-1
MNELGIRPQGLGADTMVAGYVLDPEGRHNLESLAAQHLGYKVMTSEEVCGKGKDQICFDQIPIEVATRYSAEDALVAFRLWDELKPKLESEGLMKIYTEVDLPLVMILSGMEEQGVCIDTQWLKTLSNEFQDDLLRIEQRIGAFTRGPINLNSTKQLAQLLFEELKLPVQSKTKTGYSTDAKVLEALAPLHEVPRLLLEYREISKLKGTYVDPLPMLRDAKTGKIHASFHQTVAATGRLSSSDPNLQNIPIKTERGQRIRRAFVPAEGNVLLSADYSQIELRLLAHMSGDEELSKSFRTEEDVHRRTASEIFGIRPDEVDDRQRGIAKAINFGLMYGKTAFGLSQELKIPRKEAADIIDRYFQRYSGVKRYLDQSILDAKEKGYATTVLGRKRPLREIRSANHMLRQNAERMAMNSPIQGTAADLMKLAMIEIDRRLRQGGYRAKLTIQVHDEVVLDCPKDEAKEIEKLVSEAMESAMELSVPLRVNSGMGNNWQEL